MNDEILVYDNPQARCAVSLLLDTSGSMAGEPIRLLNEGVNLFCSEVYKDDIARFSVEFEMISFGGKAERVMPFTSFADEKILPFELSANGSTPMGAAIEIAMASQAERKKFYKSAGIPYYQPWMIIMSDGQPTDAWQEPARIARDLSDSKKLVFLGIGVGNSVDIDTLGRICPANRPPKILKDLRFSEFFLWLSESMKEVGRSSVGDTIKLPPRDGWEAV